MERAHETQMPRFSKPILHVSDSKATLIEYFAEEGRGGYAVMLASTEAAADGFHYAHWSDSFKPENFYPHAFSLEEIVVPVNRSQYSKISDKHRAGKSLMLQPLGGEMLSIPGTDEVYIKLYQTIHRRYSTMGSAQAVLAYYLNEDEELSYLGGFAYEQGEHLNNYSNLGVMSVVDKQGLHSVFNDNKRNLNSKFKVRDEVFPFFTGPNPVSLVPILRDGESFKSGKAAATIE